MECGDGVEDIICVENTLICIENTHPWLGLNHAACVPPVLRLSMVKWSAESWSTRQSAHTASESTDPDTVVGQVLMSGTGYGTLSILAGNIEYMHSPFH